jgi:eukaryotic-like serine/threonine-protein kinase
MKPTLRDEEEIFDAARLIADATARAAYLARACGGDVVLRRRVEELLAAQAGAENFFASSSAAVQSLGGELQALTQSQTPPPLHDDYLGTRIGNYKLLERIGEGGCGVVYMAEQEKPVRRRVALKIIKLGMDTRAVIARFEAERQALAMMDHPNIARVLDAGATESGRPYFVMELVRGFKITEYCDANHLDTKQRLNLFVAVCHAIQHAHQKGVIHRDIKPSNILVTLHDGVPVPKVIDFGIAKATEVQLTEKTLFTAYAQIIGTPAYMSPEQAEMSGLDIDTRADIYSLGVLLYELLTGRPPFDPKQLMESGVDEMRRTLREREPQKPSTILTTLQNDDLTTTAKHRHVEPPRLISQLKGDLDWIVMRALEKDRRRRYETANALAMDVQRYLNNEPVMARPPSRTYRLQKLVRRNQAVFVSGAIVTLVLVCGLGVSTWLFLREREARKRAVEAERQQAELRVAAERGRATEAELRQLAEARAKITQAALLIGMGQLAEADGLVAEIPTSQPSLEGAAVFRTLGEWNVLQGRWTEAAHRFLFLQRASILEGWDYSSLDYSRCAVTFVAVGDWEAYEQFRQSAVQQFGATQDPIIAERTIKVCLLTPPDAALLKQLLPLYEVAAKSLEPEEVARATEGWMIPWRCISVGLMELRQGRPLEAIAYSDRSLAHPSENPARNATAHVIRAMAQHLAGNRAAAEQELGDIRPVIERHTAKQLRPGDGGRGYWFDWVLAQVLLREATGRINVNPGG